MLRRELSSMPFDKVFEIDGNEQLCHATGYEVNFDADDLDTTEELDLSNWWNEYTYKGEYFYGR